MRIAFINYGSFGNNSSLHIEGFAFELAANGHEVLIVSDGEPETIDPLISILSYENLKGGNFTAQAKAILKDPQTIFHAWTSRERVRQLIEEYIGFSRRIVVHLEDNEFLVTAGQMGVSQAILRNFALGGVDIQIPEHLSHPRESERLLRSARGITLITRHLQECVPLGTPYIVLQPGIDATKFSDRLTAKQRSYQRHLLGFSNSSTVVVYHGNTHPGVQRDIFSLYTAIAALRREGVDVGLVRMAENEITTKTSTAYRKGLGVINVGFLPRHKLLSALQLADIFIQPGWNTPFNLQRFPSKVLEFLALGKPVILPQLNSDQKLTDGLNGFILQEGGSEEILRNVHRILADPIRAKTVGLEGKAFAVCHFDWKDKAKTLEDFYASLN